jgi:hypothetical protein
MADPYIRQMAREALAQTARNPNQDFLQATPRNSILGFLSDLAASSYSPERTQQMQGIAQFMGAPAISQTLDRLSYGEPLTTGAGGIGGTTRIRPEALEAAMAVAPMVGPAGRAAGAGAMAAGRAGERFAERAVPQIMERGGFGSELLQGMSRGAESYALPPAGRSGFGAGLMPLQDEIDAARSAIQRQVIDLPSGEVQLIPRMSPFGTAGPQGLDAEVRFRTTSGRNFTVPSGQNIYIDFPITGEERQIIRAARQDISNQKNELSNLVEAQRSITSTNLEPIPQWAREMTELQSGRQAGPEWWEKALKDKSAPSFNAFAEAANNTSLMMYPSAATSKNAKDIAKNFGVRYADDSGNIVFSSGNGTLKIYDANTDNPFIRSMSAKSEGIKDGGGKSLYQAAYNWAANNGKVIKPDPRGITEINELRKIGNALSGNVRNGKIVAEMNSGNFTGLQSIADLWRAEAKIAKKRVPTINNVSFDGNKFNMDDGDIVFEISKKDPTFSKGVGAMTAKRAALADWLMTATPEQAKKAVISLLAGGSSAVFAMDDESK